MFEAAFFVPFQPATARDIVARTPGFRLEDIDQNVRGFGQAAGNVVLNGQRPSAKRDSLETILSRIPAARVLRVEVGPGDLFGAEFTGRPQVLNLVLTDAGGLSGTVEASVLRSVFDEVKPEGQASVLWERGQTRINLSAQVDNDETSERGSDIIRRASDGAIVEVRRKVNRIDDPDLGLSASLAHDGGDNRKANLNLRYDGGWFRLFQTNAVTPAEGPLRADRLDQRFDSRTVEAGGDITRPFLGGGLKLIGLITRTVEDNEEASLIQPDGVLESGFVQLSDQRSEESVLRLVWNRTTAGGWSVEAGGEGVINRLVSDTRLFALDADGGQTPIDLPIGRATVKEVRGEIFVNGGRALTPALRLDAGLTVERSRLTVTGDAEAERVLTFPRPKLSLDWRPAGGWRFQFSVTRTVNQLDFGDFVSAADLASERVNGGNANLQPQRAWELLAVAERPVLGDGVVRAELGANVIQKVQDRVPTPEGFDAPGNLGSGRSLIARTNFDLPLTRFGLNGMRATGRFSLVSTRVEDPYTLEQRRFSGNTLWVADAGLRQDLGEFAWGVTAYANSGSTFFRRNEEDRGFQQNPYVEAFAEWRPTSRTTLRLFLDNATAVIGGRERTFFVPDRSSRVPVLVEIRDRNRFVVPSLTVKHSFG